MIDNRLMIDGFCVLPKAVPERQIDAILKVCKQSFDEDAAARAKSSQGHVYAARNLIDCIPAGSLIWCNPTLRSLLEQTLGPECGLVRVLFFDKPPDRTWTLPWHKDTSIAVREHRIASHHFSRPTTKAGVPHVIAEDAVLQQMLTLRIHLDPVTDQNGPLKVVPQSHQSSSSAGQGTDSAVTILASAGDVLAMRPLITHSSGASSPSTKLHRRILHLEFASKRHLPDGYQWHTFQQYPNTAPESAKRNHPPLLTSEPDAFEPPS